MTPICDIVSGYRPERWSEVHGREAEVAILQDWCISARPPKAILFVGPSGCGKTTLSRLTAKAMACSERQDSDPEPCGSCHSCKAIHGDVGSMTIRYVTVDWPASSLKDELETARNGESIAKEDFRPMPLCMDDLDEFDKRKQATIKRSLDRCWYGFILATTTRPDRIDPALRGRMRKFLLSPPDVTAMVCWVQTVVERLGMEVGDQGALRRLVLAGQQNYRAILDLLQIVYDRRQPLTTENVNAAAA